MKIGVLGCGYQCEKELDERLNPWFNLADRYNFIFSFVSVQFKEYANLGYKYDNSETEQKLIYYQGQDLIQYTYFSTIPLIESDARDKALEPLLKENCDLIWLLDLSDEYYTETQIRDIINYIQKEEFIDWFSIPMRNYIFLGKEWISGFCPPRIWRVNIIKDTYNKFRLSKFYWDNDVVYTCSMSKPDIEKSYKEFSNKSVPKNLINDGIKHLTWLHSNGQQKYEYQMKHFGHCGYKWNYDTNQLEFNKEFHEKNNIPIPEVFKDE